MRDWLAHRARATPTATAIVDAIDGTASTYAALDERVEVLAGRLSALGVGVEDHLGVCLHTRRAFVELAHAAMRLGAVLVPLNARLTAPELATRVEQADVSVVVCGGATEDAVVDASPESVASVDAPRNEATRELADVTAVTYDLPAWDRDSPQLLMFTSGTTGQPKAVMLTMGNLVASAAASSWRLGVIPSDRWYCCLPMYHMGGIAPVYRSVLYGTVVVVEDGREGFGPGATLDRMADLEVTCTSLVPTMLDRLLDAGEFPHSLRFVLLGGAPAADELLSRSFDRNVPVCPTYGMTETASQVATARPDEAQATPGTVGNPLIGTEVSIVGPDGGTCETGKKGELVVSGPTVTHGYYGDAEATADAFGQQGFHTGDVGYRDEHGRVWVLNRLDDRIVTGGENVDPGEVVAAIREHPAVEAAAVVDVPDEQWGERVAALVVSDEEVPVADLLDHCRDRLAGYKVPRTLRFAEELPRTASDTVDRAAVREHLRDV